MSELFVYNTSSRCKEPFRPVTPGRVLMYVCGPTVYQRLHVGNFRGAIFFNLVRSWLEDSGHHVRYVYNYTDVDDKIIRRAAEEGTEPQKLTDKYILAFEEDFRELKLKAHDSNPRVTRHIPDVIGLIERLLTNGKAYVSGGEVIYDIASFKTYGNLSGKKTDELVIGSRVEPDALKKNPLDFVLWKPAKTGEPAWDSPWGKGRPGWHAECSAMILKLLGEEIDIHGGGVDLIFPHHENEIAQSEGATERRFVRYWMHNHFVEFGEGKMSKSAGNVILAKDFMREYNTEVLKFLLLSSHYRSPIRITESHIQQAVSGAARIYSAMALAEEIFAGAPRGKAGRAQEKVLEEADGAAAAALNDDFNTPELFSQIFDVVRGFNASNRRGAKITIERAAEAGKFLAWIRRWGSLMSLFQEPAGAFLKELDDKLLAQKKISRERVDALLADRARARHARDFKQADAIRCQIDELGIDVQDMPHGTHWEVRKSE